MKVKNIFENLFEEKTKKPNELKIYFEVYNSKNPLSGKLIGNSVISGDLENINFYSIISSIIRDGQIKKLEESKKRGRPKKFLTEQDTNQQPQQDTTQQPQQDTTQQQNNDIIRLLTSLQEKFKLGKDKDSILIKISKKQTEDKYNDDENYKIWLSSSDNNISYKEKPEGAETPTSIMPFDEKTPETLTQNIQDYIFRG